MFEKITLCFDSYGCPNRCRHCWIGHMQNKRIDKEQIKGAVDKFKDFSHKIEVYSWLREPDYSDDYKELWEFDNEVSINAKPNRFELMSFYRLVRDNDYVNWLKQFDIKKYQLTIFGSKETTDYYVGRKGAYEEIIKATNILLANGFVPRWQMFIYKDNIHEIKHVLSLIDELNLKERTLKNGDEFEFFIHTGSCDGENRNNYEKWIESTDTDKIPKVYYKNNGIEERVIYEELINSNDTEKLAVNDPVFYVDADLNVYQNISEMKEQWKLGNLQEDSIDTIVDRYINNDSPAQRLRRETTLGELVKKYGNKESIRLFSKDDYVDYLVNRHFEEN